MHYGAIMKFLFSVWYLLIIWNTDGLLQIFKKITKRSWLIIWFLTLFGLMLRIWIVPHLHHVYFDEFEHLNIANNLSRFGQYCVTLQGSDSFCETHTFQFWPPGYHSLLSFIFSYFGNSESVAFNFSSFIGSLSIFSIFLMVFLLFNNQKIALNAAFLFSLIPVHLKYSGASEPGITSFLFMILSIFCFLFYSRNLAIKRLLLASMTLVLSIYMRPENGILLFLMLFFFFLLSKHALTKAKEKIIVSHFIISLVLVSVLIVPYLIQIGYGFFIISPAGWNVSFAARWQYGVNNFQDNIIFWFSNFHPVILTILSIFGACQLLKTQKKMASFFIAWFCVFLLLYSQYHTGNFIKNYDSDRYALNLYLPVVAFAGYGLFRFLQHLKYKKIIMIFIFLGLIMEVIPILKSGLERTFSRDVYSQHEFLKKNRDAIPKDLYVISCLPAEIIAGVHKKAIDPFIFMKFKEKPEKIILWQDYWWNTMQTELHDVNAMIEQFYNKDLLCVSENFNKDHCVLYELTLKKTKDQNAF